MDRFNRTRKACLCGLLLLLAFVCAGQAAAQAWTQLTPSGPPAGRGYSSGVYNINSNRMIVFGGNSNVGLRNDTWVLDHADGTGGTPSWTQLAPATATAAREAHAAVYDTAGNRMIVFGGFNGAFSNDVWVLSNADGTGGTPVWTQLAPNGTPPNARDFSSAVYDSTGNRMIVYGGYNGSELSDVWVLSNANGVGTPAWTQLSTATSPPARHAHTAVYDAATNRMTVFGAYIISNNGSSELNDVWVLSNANGVGTPAWTQLSPTGTPPSARSFHTATYDPATNRMVVFGGYPANNETWVLSAANGLGTPAWTQLAPTGGPPAARFGHTAIYNAANNSMVMFGDGYSLLNDTWVLSSASGVTIVPVSIDIRPNTAINTISLTKGTTIPVAILSSATFNALTQVDRTSLTFGHAGTEASLSSCNARGQDVNADGYKDLVCQFNGTQGGFQMGDGTGTLKGKTLQGDLINGSDAVLIIK